MNIPNWEVMRTTSVKPHGKDHQMKKLPLILSATLNVGLIVALIVLHSLSTKRAFQTVADFAAAEVRLQEHVLTELESGDAARIAKIQETLRRNIENGKKAESSWRKGSRL